MGMADQADAVGLAIQAQLGEQRREHVLPHGIARAGVVEADRTLLALRAQLGEKGEVRGRDHLLGPLRREAGPAGELIERYLADDGQVVVTGEAYRGVLAGELHADVGVGSVADEVAQAPQLGRVAGGDRIEHRLEGLAVAVDIGDDRDLHGCRSSSDVPPYSSSDPASAPPYSGRFLMPSRVRHLE